MFRPLAWGLALGLPAVVYSQQPDVAQVLRLNPVQQGIVYDTPSEENQAKCKVDLLTEPERGWLVRDGRGLVIRRFVDKNGDNRVDRWSFYMNGQEVYRDVDTNFNGKADETHWYHTAGSRWGIDADEDGRIDEWKSITAEEVTMEVVAALSAGDFVRIKPLLLTNSDIEQFGLKKETVARLSEAQQKASATFQQAARAVGPKPQWNRFDGHNPMTVPADELGSSKDLVLYLNGTILVDADGQTRWLRVPEIVRVGDVWKISDVPSPIDPNASLDTEGVIVVAAQDEVSVQSDAEADAEGVVENNEEVRALVAQLRAHDEKTPADESDAKAMATFHVERSAICARIGAKSMKLANREHWYRQVADSYNAAVQTGQYPEGIKVLSEYADKFGKVEWGKTLAAYFLYRAINADYAVKLPNVADPADVQKEFLKQLGDYLTQYPEAPDAADALWQLGNGMEFTASEDDAKKYYQELVTRHPESPFAAKAQGAIKRLDAIGQPIRLAGNSLGRSPVDTSQFKGKVILISYWATWCDPCVSEMPKLEKMREKYGRAGFEIVGVCLDNDKAKAVAFLREKGYGWPQLFEEGSMESKPAVELGIISLPYLILVDANGDVINKNLQFGELEPELEKVMAQKMAAKDK